MRTWTHVAAWIVENLSTLEPMAVALCREMLAFLKEKNLLDRHFDARDLATVTLYAACDEAFRHTTRSVMKAIAGSYPPLGSFSGSSVGVDGSIGAFMGWMYFGAALQPARSRFWIGLGICGEPAAAAFDDDFIRTSGREPFVMIHWGDEYGGSKPIDHVSSHPKGWIEVKIRPALIVTKPIREFAGDPEGRAEDIKKWACEEVGALTRVMKARREGSHSRSDHEMVPRGAPARTGSRRGDGSGLPMKTSGGIYYDHPIYREMETVIWSKEGKAVALEAVENGLPAMAKVDPLLQRQMETRYSADQQGTLHAGFIVAEMMRLQGYEPEGSAALPPGCVAKTTALYRPKKLLK